MNLDQEIATYYRHLPELLAQQGKWVLIKGTEIAGTWDSYSDALTAGYHRFKLNGFLVKQITAVERVVWFCFQAAQSLQGDRSWESMPASGDGAVLLPSLTGTERCDFSKLRQTNGVGCC
jgi:hypothetical protein